MALIVLYSTCVTGHKKGNGHCSIGMNTIGMYGTVVCRWSEDAEMRGLIAHHEKLDTGN